MKRDREKLRPLSLSMSGHCRMELWLTHKKRVPEPIEWGGQRTMELGSVIEALLFDDFEIPTAYGTETIGSWLSEVDEVSDPVSGFKFSPKNTKFIHRQMEVDLLIDGETVTGHIDALGQDVAVNAPGWTLFDAKSANGLSFRRALTEKLEEGIFARELYAQMQAYMRALQLRGIDARRAVLIYFNKEQSKLMCRLVPFDAERAEDGVLRLRSAMAQAEPEPDWPMAPGQDIELRCGYCSMKQHCARQRGFALELHFKKGRNGETPAWRVK
jgi:hypothetical protein